MGAIRDHIHHAKASSRNHTDGAHTENRSRSSIQRSPQAVVPLQTTRSHAKPAVSAALMPKTSSDAATAGGSVVMYRPLTATDLPAIIDEYDQFANELLSTDPEKFKKITDNGGFLKDFYIFQ